MKKVLIVVGTRPNFIKITQFKRVFTKFPDIDVCIVHTGQHYDNNMAEVFFKQFELVPDHYLEVEPSTPNTQIAAIMIKLEKLIKEKYPPDLLLVPGDVNSTLAGALVANKLGIPLGHIESGLRSFDRTMPEEHNRKVTDELADYCFVTEQSGLDNLKKEGKSENAVYFVGNTMIDTLVAYDKKVQASNVLQQFKLAGKEFVLMTMHRPATVDNRQGLEKLVALIDHITGEYPVVFPIHPRTLKKLEVHSLKQELTGNPKVILTEPLDYFSFQKLICEAKCILTDSGGIQEESTFRRVPCLTLRPNTERPVTVSKGTNTLVPFDVPRIMRYIDQIQSGSYKKGKVPALWDGQTTARITKIIQRNLSDLALQSDANKA